jgi:hypothetical protein
MYNTAESEYNESTKWYASKIIAAYKVGNGRIIAEKNKHCIKQMNKEPM